MLRWRLLLGTLIIAVLVALGWLDQRGTMPGVWLLPAAVAFTLLSTAEVLHLARASGMRPLAWPVYAGNLAIVLGQWLPSCCDAGHGSAANGVLASTLALAVLLAFVGEMLRYEKPGGVLAGIAVSVFALVYVGVMLAFAVQLRMGAGWGMGAIASWVIVVKMTDTGAFTAGRLFGRHKMAPRLSPGKTIEGNAKGVGSL
jgi:phosphatidate cytidylyltransferase